MQASAPGTPAVLGAIPAGSIKQNIAGIPGLGFFKSTDGLPLLGKTVGSPMPSSPPSQPTSAADFCFSSPPRRKREHTSSSRLSSAVPPSSPPSLLPTSPALSERTLPKQTASPQIIYLEDQESLTVQRGQTVHFGRKLRTMQKAAPEDHSAIFVVLPKAAKHASRKHATVTICDEIVIIHALGQNGVLIDGETLAEGESQDLRIDEVEAGFVIGFYSDLQLRLDIGESTQHRLAQKPALEADPTSEATALMDLPSSPSWSRAASPEAQRPTKRAKMGSLSRASSEAVPSSDPYAHQADNGYPPESSDESEDADEDEAARAAALAKDSKQREAFMRIKAAVRDGTVDLTGALCSSLVFQTRRATLTTSECVAVLLEDQPSLLSYGGEDCWRAAVLSCLRSGPFGMIQNTEGLKDAAGRIVETSWHYSPREDTDEGRRSSLQPFVKTVRAVQRVRPQYYFKRPSDLKKGRRS